MQTASLYIYSLYRPTDMSAQHQQTSSKIRAHIGQIPHYITYKHILYMHNYVEREREREIEMPKQRNVERRKEEKIRARRLI